MMKKKYLFAALTMAVIAGSCSKDDVNPADAGLPVINLTVPAGGFTADSLQWVRINPEVPNAGNARYLWMNGNDTLATTKDLQFVSDVTGVVTLRFSVSNSAGESFKTVEVKISAPSASYKTGVTKVFEYFPAPGQFINTMPAWNDGDNAEKMAAAAQAALSEDGLVSLGGFGGYIVMGFDHIILNKPGKNSFRIIGNAFGDWSEPGIIEVSADVNGNGLPDDEWYEIAGSEYNSPHTIKNYQITYYKPDENKEKTPDPNNQFLTDTSYIRWKDNQGNAGFLSRNMFYSQPYYPAWKGDSITFTGSRLADQIEDLSGNGTYFVNHAFPYGYADNQSNDDEKSAIRIEWAVDKEGNPARLPGINFIRVYSAVRAEAGWLGEISTDLTGAVDLNVK